MPPYPPQVLLDEHAHPLIVFAKGRTLYHAITARDRDIALLTLDTLRGLRPLLRQGLPYPPKRAASFWLNHAHRPPTKRAAAVLRGLVARKAAT